MAEAGQGSQAVMLQLRRRLVGLTLSRTTCRRRAAESTTSWLMPKARTRNAAVNRRFVIMRERLMGGGIGQDFSDPPGFRPSAGLRFACHPFSYKLS